MKKVIFFTDTEWAYGTIHIELTKYLFKHNILSNVLFHQKTYSIDEIKELDSVTDCYLMSPNGLMALLSYGVIDPAKCIVVCHGLVDLEQVKNDFGPYIDLIKNYVTVSNYLKQKSIEYGIKRIPKVCNIGINYNNFCNTPISNELKTIGYAGFYMEKNEIDQYRGNPKNNWVITVAENKRSWLVKEIAEKTNLNFKVAQHYHNTWITMPGFYSNIDCVMVSTMNEGAGLPLLEGGASGKLIISTPVGLIFDLCSYKGANIVSFNEAEYVKESCDLLNYYKSNPEKYRERCQEIKEHAKLYDWENVIEKWIELFN